VPDEIDDPEAPEVLSLVAERLRSAGATTSGVVLREAIAYSFGPEFAGSTFVSELCAFGERHGIEDVLALLGAAEKELGGEGG
jgi:hypothetical protein